MYALTVLLLDKSDTLNAIRFTTVQLIVYLHCNDSHILNCFNSLKNDTQNLFLFAACLTSQLLPQPREGERVIVSFFLAIRSCRYQHPQPLPYISQLTVSFSVTSTAALLLTGPERALDLSANSAEPEQTFNAKCRREADYQLLK